MESLLSDNPNNATNNLLLNDDSTSSSEDDYENETIFAFHKKTGEWIAFQSDDEESDSSQNRLSILSNWFKSVFNRFKGYKYRKRKRRRKGDKNADFQILNGSDNSSDDDEKNTNSDDSDTPLIAV